MNHPCSLRRTATRSLAALLVFRLPSLTATAATTGLNLIPTVDTVHVERISIETENGNTRFVSPAWSTNPQLLFNTQYGLTRRSEAGVDLARPEPAAGQDFTPGYQAVFNYKYRAAFEAQRHPAVSLGVQSIGVHRSPVYFLAFAKTLDYDELHRPPVPPDTSDILHTHNDVPSPFGQRLHLGALCTGSGTVLGYAGLDAQVSESVTAMADWTAGAENGASLGFEYILPNHKTSLHPALIYSNSAHRIDGFFLNISNESRLDLSGRPPTKQPAAAPAAMTVPATP